MPPHKPFESLYNVIDTHWVWHGSFSDDRPCFQGGPAARFAYQREFDVELGRDSVTPCRTVHGCVSPHHATVRPYALTATVCIQCKKDWGCRDSFEGVRRVCKGCRAEWRATQIDRDLVNTRSRAERVIVRRRILEHYGGACACCGEAEEVFLVMDHIEDDGAEHRRATGYKSIYTWLAKNDCPPGFQILCHNCNYAKAHGGCPHGALCAQPGGGA